MVFVSSCKKNMSKVIDSKMLYIYLFYGISLCNQQLSGGKVETAKTIPFTIIFMAFYKLMWSLRVVNFVF